MTSSSRDLQELERIARAAGDRLRPLLGSIARSEIEFKGPMDLVTRADRESEALIVNELARAFPGVKILGEETSPDTELAGELWLVDPLDGTTNFAHGHPVYAVSIGLVRNGVVELGVVHAPSLDETFAAARGSGGILNGRRLRVSTVATVAESLLATGFASLRRPGGIDNIPAFSYLVRRSEGVRRDGAAALDLAWVACGRHDGFWEYNLSPWDLAAGSLLVEEAGGRVTGMPENLPYLGGGAICATNGRIHAELMAAIHRAMT